MSVKVFKMTLRLKSCFSFVLFLKVIGALASGNDEVQVDNRTCSPAEDLPSLNSSLCHPLMNFTSSVCKDRGIDLSKYVFVSPKDQRKHNIWTYKAMENLRSSKRVFPGLSDECINSVVEIVCRYLFPPCDGTKSVYQKKKICKETCFEFVKPCSGPAAKVKLMFQDQDNQFLHLLDCRKQPFRNAGESPECSYFNRPNSSRGKEKFEQELKDDCLYLSGSSYGGNISVTASAIPCQSWISQCPHRHTMNSMYPELNNASNYCRNPRNSGKRPWCFTTDKNKRWEYCEIPKCIPVDGNYGSWSLSSQCSVSCGHGFEIWRRRCNNPSPRYGGRNCSDLGNSTEYRRCTRKVCPVNGGYGNWSLWRPCNASCGKGFEIWKRACNNPTPRYGGRSCSVLGNSTDYRQCSRKPCPIDGNYSNWTKTSNCSVSCGKGRELWTRECNNPPPQYGGDCSKEGLAEETRPCYLKACPAKRNITMIAGTSGGGIAVILLVILVVVSIYKKIRRKREEDFAPYSVFFFDAQKSRNLQEVTPHVNGTVVEHSNQNTHSPIMYQNLTKDGEPLPGHCRGVVMYERHYMNTGPSCKPQYTKLQLFRPIVIDWLRNAWGNVDQFGRHVYDVMQRASNVFVPYNKRRIAQPNPRENGRNELGAIDETGNASYDKLQGSS